MPVVVDIDAVLEALDPETAKAVREGVARRFEKDFGEMFGTSDPAPGQKVDAPVGGPPLSPQAEKEPKLGDA